MCILNILDNALACVYSVVDFFSTREHLTLFVFRFLRIPELYVKLSSPHVGVDLIKSPAMFVDV